MGYFLKNHWVNFKNQRNYKCITCKSTYTVCKHKNVTKSVQDINRKIISFVNVTQTQHLIQRYKDIHIPPEFNAGLKI